jgi:hypothetical protein
MANRLLRVCVVAVAGCALVAPASAWAADLPAGACQTVGDSICGAGRGVIDSASGDVSLGRNGAVNPVGGGTAILGGDRILARDGTAQVSLGRNCQTSIPANSVSLVTHQDGLICLQSSNAAATGPEGYDPNLVMGVGVLGLIAVGTGIAIATSSHEKHSVSP